jgi:hypothetical protein
MMNDFDKASQIKKNRVESFSYEFYMKKIQLDSFFKILMLNINIEHRT